MKVKTQLNLLARVELRCQQNNTFRPTRNPSSGLQMLAKETINVWLFG